ncbi:uncharacterized protein METZ01_LOCUS32836 [marine metagenome]|uniref:Uncharacterized protein n=1 Tax=marine metagenome TaxID=408172 RepID=A0A381QKW1_9ZZZZ
MASVYIFRLNNESALFKLKFLEIILFENEKIANRTIDI